MMKKFVMLMLVLGMASLASAGLQISINGNQEPIDSQLTLYESETAILDVWTDAAIPAFQADSIALIALDNTIGTVDGSGYTSPLIPPLNLVGQVEDASFVLNPAGSTGVYGGFLPGMAGIAAGATLYDNIILHAEALTGDAIIELWGMIDTDPDPVGENWVLTTLYDTAIVHVPEPMTMVLLGLGGLFLRRRK